MSELNWLRRSELPMDLHATIERLHQELEVPACFGVQRFNGYLTNIGSLVR